MQTQYEHHEDGQGFSEVLSTGVRTIGSQADTRVPGTTPGGRSEPSDQTGRLRSPERETRSVAQADLQCVSYELTVIDSV